jgi:hypothetical protein
VGCVCGVCVCVWGEWGVCVRGACEGCVPGVWGVCVWGGGVVCVVCV